MGFCYSNVFCPNHLYSVPLVPDCYFRQTNGTWRKKMQSLEILLAQFIGTTLGSSLPLLVTALISTFFFNKALKAIGKNGIKYKFTIILTVFIASGLTYIQFNNPSDYKIYSYQTHQAFFIVCAISFLCWISSLMAKSK